MAGAHSVHLPSHNYESLALLIAANYGEITNPFFCLAEDTNSLPFEALCAAAF